MAARSLESNGRHILNKSKQYKCRKFWQKDGMYCVTQGLPLYSSLKCFWPEHWSNCHNYWQHRECLGKILKKAFFHELLHSGSGAYRKECHIFYFTHYVFTVFKKYTKYRIMLKIVKYDLKNA